MKRIIACLLSLLLVVGVLPLAQPVLADGSLNLYDITSTNYGVIDKDVVATRFAEGEGYDIVYPPNPADYEESEFAFATPCVIIREKYDANTYKYSLVSSHRVVKTYLATQEPEIDLISCMDHNGNYPDYSIYRVSNPQTGKYDVYNANTDTYYEYGLDYIVSTYTDYCYYDYWSGYFWVQKDGKEGLLDKTGKMLYEPIYNDVRYYKNCAVGWATVNSSSQMAILSNNGKTSGTVFYYTGVWQDDYLLGVRSSDNYNYAAISPTTLKVLTEFKYKNCKTATYLNTPYLVGEVQFTCNDNLKQYYEIVYRDKVMDSRTLTGYDNNYWDNSTYFSGGKYQYGTFSFTCSTLDSTSYSYKVVNFEGKTLYTSTTQDQYYKYLVGYMNQTAITYEYVSGTNTRVYKLYNSAHQELATCGMQPEVWGNYLITTSNGELFIYNYMSGEIVYTGGTVVDYNLFNKYLDTNINKMILLENAEGMRGLFHLQSAKFSGFIFTKEEMNSITMDAAVTNGTRGAWNFSDKENNTKYITDSFAVIPAERLIVSGDCLLEDTYQPEFETDRLWDYDGNVVKEFIRRSQNSYDEYEEEQGFSEGWGTYDSETKLQGLITPEGKEVLGNHYYFVGETRNGLTLVASDRIGSEYKVALVDNNGNALLYGQYHIGFLKSIKFYDRDQGGFIALNKQENNKQCVYLYDYTACLGLGGGEDLPDEDILFGEYSSYLDSNFYNTAAQNITETVANAVAKKTTHSAQVIALAKSGLDGGTEYVVKKLISLIPATDINEAKVNQEIALKYLEALDTDTVAKYVDQISTVQNFAEKLESYYTNIKDLAGEKKIVEFCNLWSNGSFSKNDIYQLLETGQKNADKLGKFAEQTGRVVTVAEYVMTYVMVCSIESEMIECLMDLVPQDSALYSGLSYIRLQQKDKFMKTFAAEVFSDEMISAFCDLAEEGLVKLVTDAKPSLVLFLVKTGMKLIASQIDSPKMEDIDKAVLAFANILTLQQSVKDYRAFIRSNYQNKGDASLDDMKYEYEVLMRTYFQALIVGLEYAETLENEQGKLPITQMKESYITKLRYYSYIQTCLINATAMWEYTVEANKAVLNQLKAQFPKGEGRVPLYDLMFTDNYNLNDLYAAQGSNVGYCIDLPSSVDGYSVSGVASGSVSGQSKIQGVYVPSQVESVDANAFQNCQKLETVFVGATTSVEEDSFGEVTATKREKEVVSVQVVTPPAQTDLAMQEELDTTGLVLLVTYADGTTQQVTEGVYASLENRVNGANTVTVSYYGVTATYGVTVQQSECTYIVSYVDTYGNPLMESTNGTAQSGETLVISAPAIEGYTPTAEQLSHVVGFENRLTFVYTAVGKMDIEQAIIQVEDGEFNGQSVVPNVVVTLNGKVLTQGVDYTLKFDNNLLPGTGNVFVFGCGDYQGILEGEFTITGTGRFGDVDGNEKISATDALWVLQASVGKRTLTELQKVLADVDGDQNQNAKDALLILRYSVNKIDKFPVEQ